MRNKSLLVIGIAVVVAACVLYFCGGALWHWFLRMHGMH